MCAAFHEFSRPKTNPTSNSALSTGGTPTERGNGEATDIVAGSINNVPPTDFRLSRLLALIEADPLGDVHQWAQQVNLSTPHLQRLFKQATGVSLTQVLTTARLTRAATLLRTSSLSIKEVASAAGYQHTSSFTRAFERYFHTGPRRYRTGQAA